MTNELRAIAVSVEAAGSGYRWLHLEREQDSEIWAVLDRSPEQRTTYHQAMAEGLVALELLVDDLAVGPRSAEVVDYRSVEQKDATPAPQADEVGKEPSKSYFGFGPAM